MDQNSNIASLCQNKIQVPLTISGLNPLTIANASTES